MNLEPATIAKPDCPRASAMERFSVTMRAEKPRGAGPGSLSRLGLRNYRGQNCRFMRLFHRENSRLVCRAIPRLWGHRIARETALSESSPIAMAEQLGPPHGGDENLTSRSARGALVGLHGTAGATGSSNV